MDKYNQPDLMIIMCRAHISQPDGTFGMKVSSFRKDYNWVCQTFASDKGLFRSFEENNNSSLSQVKRCFSFSDQNSTVELVDERGCPEPTIMSEFRWVQVLGPSPSQEWS